ncbi:hypothetical protein RRV45_15120 [Bacillus sp. DTU_2020_1000418_1_SI_GHA_SEK_038]|uniref:hypothetical protein n=1 Tax=Bacillus sp. DTU_2020_1000418_1_SI_GHA_SEK_038 TaxID=3077585 RepID=UPI0028E9F19B|nr:hypothetical protein [Bacillus sp. DTU_2020_1000418_1_SI_GHA_SEK_038]WNS74240.1 hypothetical protein RRV45_15120 [Bacillus sp. DTU_2020_1000418_1_SI_GHA_SEK_038]
MPTQTQEAVSWALTQKNISDLGYEMEQTPSFIVEKVREYFNDHNIEYNTFSYDDLEPYLI